MDIIESLMLFSLTRQEANLYMTLLVEGALSGYEAAKHSGISRSNCYTALASLVEKGAAVIEEDTVTRYKALPAEEFCENKIRALAAVKKHILQSIPKPKNDTGGYITISGSTHILDKAMNMISSAGERIYVSVNRTYLEQLIPCLKEASSKGLKVVVITDKPFPSDTIIFYKAKNYLDQLRLIVDSNAVLTGDIVGDCSCLYSVKRNLVELFKQTLKDEIRLIELNAE